MSLESQALLVKFQLAALLSKKLVILFIFKNSCFEDSNLKI